MSDKDFVFRIGPIAAGQSSGFIYGVLPGLPDEHLFPARDDAAAWLRIGERFELGQLACEPLLDTPDKPPHVLVEPHDRHTAHALAVTAYRYMPCHPMSHVRSEGLISDFVLAAKAYRQGTFASGAAPGAALTARFEGSPAFSALARIEDTPDRRTALRVALPDVTDRATGHAIVFGVDFRIEPAFAVDALRRAFDLDTLPVPVLPGSPGTGRPNDVILLMLIPLLTALAHLEAGEVGATGRFDAGDRLVTCRVRLE